MKILVAEDSPVMRKILTASLQRWGYDVTEAEDGTAAWDRFQQEEYQLVLTDWVMPGVDGYELVRRIRTAGRPYYVYLILLTAKSEKENLVQAMEAGADDFLAKPFASDELRVRVAQGERVIRLQTTLTEQNQKLREAQAALMQSEKLTSLAQLAAGMAHEINNPIAYVSNNLTVLRRNAQDLDEILAKYQEGRDDLTRVNPRVADEAAHLEQDLDLAWIREELPRTFEASIDGLKRVRDIVKNLRDFARLDEADFESVDLRKSVECALNMVRPELDKRKIHVLVESEDVPRVFCRPLKVNQVFYNLLLNAIQASEDESTIEIRTCTDGEGVRVEIEDDGTGIDRNNMPRIFEPFFTTRPVGQGKGLGLALSYGTIRDHGGRIDVESEVGYGSTFRVWLPLKPAPVA